MSKSFSIQSILGLEENHSKKELLSHEKNGDWKESGNIYAFKRKLNSGKLYALQLVNDLFFY